MAPPVRLLIVEEDPALRGDMVEAVSRLEPGVAVSAVPGPDRIGSRGRRSVPDLIYVGLPRPDAVCASALLDLRGEGSATGTVVVIDAHRSAERLVHAFEVFLRRPGDDTRRLGQEARLAIPVANRIALVKVGDICWIEGAGKYVRVHTRGKVYLLRELLQDLEVQLDSSKFIRIHRSTIVNVDCISTLEHAGRGEYGVHLEDGTELKLTRSYRSHLHTLTGGLVGDPPLAARPRD